MIGIPTRRRVQAVLVAAALLPCVALLAGKHCYDLDVYRAGGRAVLEGRPLYVPRIRGNGFTYPPFAGLFATVPAALSLGAATVLMSLASLVALAVFVRHCAGDVLRRAYAAPTLPAVAGLALLVCCEPVRATLWNGQVDLLLAALVVTDVHGRRWGGAGVGVAAAIKLTPALFVVYLLMRGRRREAGNAIGSFAVATALAWAILPADSTRYWTHEVFAGSGLGDIAGPTNQSIYAVALRAVGPSAWAGWLVVAVPSAVVGLRLAARLAAQGREPFALGVVGVTGCLVSPVSWSHHWIWCIPWLIGMAERARGRASKAWVVVLVAVFADLYLAPLSLMARWPAAAPVVGDAFLGAALLTGAGCTLRGRVLNRNWHSTSVSASRGSEVCRNAGRPSRALTTRPPARYRVHPRQ